MRSIHILSALAYKKNALTWKVEDFSLNKYKAEHCKLTKCKQVDWSETVSCFLLDKDPSLILCYGSYDDATEPERQRKKENQGN